MSESSVLKFAAIVGGIFGLALVFMPNGLLAMYGAQPMNASGIYNSMLYGGTLIAFAVMNWAASGASTRGQTRYVILGNVVGNLAGLLIAITRQLTPGAAAPAGWLNVGIFLVLTALFALIYFRPQAKSRAAA